MSVQAWFQIFIAQLQGTSMWEWIAMIFGVLSVLLARSNRVGLYPTGIVSTVIYIAIFWTVKLYADALLNGYYLVMSVYGWILWTRKKGEAITIHRSDTKEWIIALLIAGIGWAFLYFILRSFTNSDVPLWDAFVSATAWCGMWLLARRKVENWILLNISNIVAIPLLFYKHLPLMSLLTVFLFIVAVLGYFRWKRIMKETALHQDSSLPDLAPFGRYPDQP